MEHFMIIVHEFLHNFLHCVYKDKSVITLNIYTLGLSLSFVVFLVKLLPIDVEANSLSIWAM